MFFQRCCGFDWQLRSEVIDNEWEVFAEAERDRDRVVSLDIFSTLAVKDRTGQLVWMSLWISLSASLFDFLSFCLSLTNSKQWLVIYWYECKWKHACMYTHTIIRGMKASRLLILSIISMLNEQLCCCDWNSPASSCKCSQSDICCSAPSAWGLCCN